MDFEYTKLKCFGSCNEKQCSCLFWNFKTMKLGCLKDYDDIEHPPGGKCEGYVNMLVNKWIMVDDTSGVTH